MSLEIYRKRCLFDDLQTQMWIYRLFFKVFFVMQDSKYVFFFIWLHYSRWPTRSRDIASLRMLTMACGIRWWHYSDVIISVMASQFTGLSIVYSTVCWGADQRKHQSSASLAFVRWIHRWPVNSTHKWPVTRKMFPFDDVIMNYKIECIFVRPMLELI